MRLLARLSVESSFHHETITNQGSNYNDDQKTSEGSPSLWKELVQMGLLNTIVDHIRQLPAQ